MCSGPASIHPCLDPFYIVTYYKIGQDFLDIQSEHAKEALIKLTVCSGPAVRDHVRDDLRGAVPDRLRHAVRHQVRDQIRDRPGN